MRHKKTAKNHAECIKVLAKQVGLSVLNKYDEYGEKSEEVVMGIPLSGDITLADKVDAILEHLGLVVTRDRKAKCVKRSSRGNFPAGATKVAEAPTCVVDEEEGPL